MVRLFFRHPEYWTREQYSSMEIGEQELEGFHRTYPSSEDDPYQTIAFLGQGGFGSVEQVYYLGDRQRLYARKRLNQNHILQSRRLETIREVIKEAKIIKRYQHHHIVKLVETYQWGDQFCVVMTPVAETDLNKYLMRLDELGPSPERKSMRELILHWPVCLIRALDFLHEMRIKHRDIKPSNILVKNGQVLLTDFGLSKVVPADDTTGTTGPVGAHTRIYSAPEVLTSKSPRGRAVDIFSLGCVFLELCTALLAPKGSRDQFFQLCWSRSSSLSYANNEELILHWIWFLWAHWSNSVKGKRQDDKIARKGGALPDLAFLMLDPDAEKRITTRQLMALIATPRLYYFRSFNKLTCEECRLEDGYEDPHVPLHSEFKDTDDLTYAEDPKHALRNLPAPDWESAKRAWLAKHMW